MEGIDVDLQTVAGITPLMMAANNGNIYLMQECLNANMNPFLKDGLNQTAYDYVQVFKDSTLGEDLKQLILAAREQWEAQTTEEQRMMT